MRLRGEGGQATVEFALCLPIVALVLAAVVEVGLLVADQARLWHAAREAARVAVVDADGSDILAAARASGLDHLEVSVEPQAPYRIQGRPLTVALVYDPPGRVPLLGRVFDRVRLKARATMRVEKP